MLEKYRKLIISQLCGIFGVGAAVLGFLRYQESRSLTEQMTMGFFFFAVVLFGLELKLLVDWLKARKAASS